MIVREYGFELRLCAHLEAAVDGIVARQLGGGVHTGGRRILDIVVVAPGPAFERRSAITSETIPPLAIESDVGAGRWQRWPAGVDIRPETAERLLEEAVRVGFFERDRRRGADWVRQSVRYPDWIGDITAIENKPDLGAPGDLSVQLRQDVSLGLVDRVVLATESHVTGAHLNRIPDDVGVWRVRPGETDVSVEVIREPTRLDTSGWGTEIAGTAPTKTDIRVVSPAEKARTRIRLGERAYGKGWRPGFPGCTQVEVATASGTESLPYCGWKDRVVDPAGCGVDCPGYEAADSPSVDRAGEREDRTLWIADPPGVTRAQAGLATFSNDDDPTG